MIFVHKGETEMCDIEFHTQICNALKDKKSPKQQYETRFESGQHTRIPRKAPVAVRHLFNMFYAEEKAQTDIKMVRVMMLEDSDRKLSGETAREMELIGRKIEVIINLIDVIILKQFPEIVLGDDENIILFKAWSLGYRQ